LDANGLSDYEDTAYIADTEKFALGGTQQTWSNYLASNQDGWDLGFDADEIATFSAGYETTASDGDKVTKTGLAAVEAAFVDDAVKDGDYPDTEIGRAQAKRVFGRYPQVKQLQKARETDLMRHWKEHPKDLLKAIEANETEPSIEKEKILEDAGLIP
jgi:hypothetical protein